MITFYAIPAGWLRGVGVGFCYSVYVFNPKNPRVLDGDLSGSSDVLAFWSLVVGSGSHCLIVLYILHPSSFVLMK